MDILELNAFYEPKDRLRLTVGNDRSYPTVKPVWSAPLSRLNTYLALLDGKGQEIAMLPDLNAVSKESREAIESELRRRYMTATISSIIHASVEFGATYWKVETDRGHRDFVTQSLQENAMWLAPTHLLLLDVDGNRFEILDTSALDEKSRSYIRAIL